MIYVSRYAPKDGYVDDGRRVNRELMRLARVCQQLDQHNFEQNGFAQRRVWKRPWEANGKGLTGAVSIDGALDYTGNAVASKCPYIEETSTIGYHPSVWNEEWQTLLNSSGSNLKLTFRSTWDCMWRLMGTAKVRCQDAGAGTLPFRMASRLLLDGTPAGEPGFFFSTNDGTTYPVEGIYLSINQIVALRPGIHELQIQARLESVADDDMYFEVEHVRLAALGYYR